MSERYKFEHVFLPAVFYEKTGLDFLRGLIENHSMCLVEYFKAFTATNQPGNQRTGICPYSEANTSVRVHYITGDSDTCVIQLNLPEPTGVPECKCIFLLCGPGGINKNYITLEKSFHNQYVFCAWDEAHNHLNYGHPIVAEDDVFKAFITLFFSDQRDVINVKSITGAQENKLSLPVQKEPSSIVAVQPVEEITEPPVEPVAVSQPAKEITDQPVEPIIVQQSKPTVRESEKIQGTSTDRKLYCRKCGQQLPKDSSFCMFCGEKIITVL